jgi:hypothetical protein
MPIFMQFPRGDGSFELADGLNGADSDPRLQSKVDLFEVGLNCQPQHPQPSNESKGLFSKLSFLYGNHTFPHFYGLDNFVHHSQPF